MMTSLTQQLNDACGALGIPPPAAPLTPSPQDTDYLHDLPAKDAPALIAELQKASRQAAQPANAEAFEIRQAQLNRRLRTHATIAELGREGVMELIAEFGVGGTVDKLNLTHADFRAWVRAEIGADSLTIAEQMHAEQLLSRAERTFDRVPGDKVEASHNAEKARTFMQLAGIFDRNRGPTAPKLDINVHQQKTVEVQIFAGATNESQIAADRNKADRQRAIAQARVAYGTGQYIDPPAWQQWVNGEFDIADHELQDYLMLRAVPEIALAYSDVLEGAVVSAEDDASAANVEPEIDSMAAANQLLETQ
jgi:hypothetical protein